MANRYWNPAWAANWQSTSSWSDTDGGATGQSVPSTWDDVFFTATNVNNCTINTSVGVLSITSTWYTWTISWDTDKTRSITLGWNWTTTWTLKLSGNSSINRLIVNSSIKWTPRTISAWSVTLSNIDFQDITWEWSASWNISSITWWSWDCWGNSNITFTTPTTTNWESWATWSTATWSVRVPLPQDTATFTTAGTATITQDMPRIGSVNFTWSSDKTWTTSTDCIFFGSINLTNLATLTASTNVYTYWWRWTSTITSSWKTYAKNFHIDAVSWTLQLLDSIDLTNWTTWTNFRVYSWTLTTNNHNITTGSFDMWLTSSTRTVNLWSSTIDCKRPTSTSFLFTTTTGLTFNAWTSTIKISGVRTSNQIALNWGSWLTFYNVWIASTGAYTETITGSNTFNDFKIDTGRTVNFTNSTTTTVNTFTATGTAGNLITLRNSSSTTKATLAKAWGGVISCDYMDVDYLVWSPADTWYMGENSTDGGNNTNIYFEAPILTSIKSFNWLAYASVKSVNWLAIASVKSYNWLT